MNGKSHLSYKIYYCLNTQYSLITTVNFKFQRRKKAQKSHVFLHAYIKTYIHTYIHL